MKSPGQFEHALVARAKAHLVAVALANGLVPAQQRHARSEERLSDAPRGCLARQESVRLSAHVVNIYPAQIQPIAVDAMAPDYSRFSAAPRSSWRRRRPRGARFSTPAIYTIAPVPNAISEELIQRAHVSRSAEAAEARRQRFSRGGFTVRRRDISLRLPAMRTLGFLLVGLVAATGCDDHSTWRCRIWRCRICSPRTSTTSATAVCTNLASCGQLDAAQFQACKDVVKANDSAQGSFDVQGELDKRKLKINDSSASAPA